MKNLKKIQFCIGAVILSSVLILGCKDEAVSPNNEYNGKTTALFNPNLTYGTMADIDGNVYKTITIGTQTWMAENLRTTKYRNGDAVQTITDKLAWNELTTGAYCNIFNSTNIDTIATFGRLYNGFAVLDARNIAPSGWHVPTDADWSTLSDFIGGKNIAGAKMKESGISHWMEPNSDATNETGFTALPVCYRVEDGTFFPLYIYAHFWSSTLNYEIVVRKVETYSSECGSGEVPKGFGFAVRLVKD